MDRSYHEKIVKGYLQPVDTYLTEAEIHNMMQGKYKGDGRRMDKFIIASQLAVEWDEDDT